MRENARIKKQLSKVIATGTPKKKALFVAMNWLDLDARGAETNITEEELRQVIDSLKDKAERTEYNKWLGVYEVYRRLMNLCGLVYKEYTSSAERVLGYLRVWEEYDNEENNLNRIYEQLFSEESDQRKEAFARTIKTLSLPYGEIVQDGDGYVEIKRDELLEKIDGAVEDLLFNYSTAKAFVVALEAWTKKKKGKDFMPETMASALNDIKRDYALEVGPKYSKAELRARREQGYLVTQEEARIAVFPSYEELEANKGFVQVFKDKIEEFAIL